MAANYFNSQAAIFLRDAYGKTKKLTQKDKVLYHLKKNSSIIVIEVTNEYHIVDLAGCIRNLIKTGIQIEKRWEKNPMKFNIYKRNYPT